MKMMNFKEIIKKWNDNKHRKNTGRKKAILLKHYTFDEICEILGYDDGSNSDVSNPEMEKLKEDNWEGFYNKMLDEAIINGNFEEVIKNDVRYAL